MTSKAFGLAQLGNAFADGALSNRNKVINGAITIDQRNAGAAVSVGSGAFYGPDRWGAYGNLASKISIQQNAGSVSPPDGYSNYVGITVDAAANVSLTSSDVFQLYQSVEGFNLVDIAFGTPNAKPLALSFWARSSLTGTFSGSLYFGSNVASHPFSYSISVANTWEFKTVTIAATSTYAPTNTTNGFGAALTFDLGAGSTYEAAAGAWAVGTFTKATGGVDLVETNGATFYITGVQLEAGDTATPFEHRSFGQELALCQRYYFKTYDSNVAPATNTSASQWIGGSYAQTTNITWGAAIRFAVTMRATPTVTFYTNAGTSGQLGYSYLQVSGTGAVTQFGIGSNSVGAYHNGTASGLTAGDGVTIYGHVVASAEL